MTFPLLAGMLLTKSMLLLTVLVLHVILRSVTALTFTGICGNANPNSMIFHFCTIDSETGLSTLQTNYSTVGGILSNEFALTNKTGFFVSIDIKSTNNNIYEIDPTKNGAIVSHTPLPHMHVLTSIEVDPSDGKLYGLLIQSGNMYFVEIPTNLPPITMLLVGSDFLQIPGLSAFSPIRRSFFAICSTSFGSVIVQVDTQSQHLSITPLNNGKSLYVSSMAWDDTEMKLYFMDTPEGKNATLYTIDVFNKGPALIIARIPKYSTGAGVVTFVNHVYYTVHLVRGSVALLWARRSLGIDGRRVCECVCVEG